MTRRAFAATAAGILALMLLVATTRIARAASISGHTALALGVIVGEDEPGLTSPAKYALARLFADKTVGAKMSGVMTVTADSISCRAGNVDIAAFTCALKFGDKTINLSGRQAHELFATLIEAGVPSDGAAGTIYEAMTALRCTINPAEVNTRAGGGADCSFQAGP